MKRSLSLLCILLFAALATADVPQEWTRQFQSAENTFNSRDQYASVALFQALINQITTERSKRALNEQELNVLAKSLDYVGQAYYNNNEEGKARTAFQKIVEVSPNYKMDEDLVSSKIIELFLNLKKQTVGTIKIVSNPKQATVRIDGQFVGSTDLDAASTKGDHVLEVSKPGYMAETKNITVTPGSTTQLQFDLVVNPEGLKFYKDGIAELQKLNIKGAEDLLAKAVADQPDYALIHAALADTWLERGYGDKAQEEAKKALDLSQDLAQEEKMLVEATYAETQYNWDKAAENYRTLLSSQPDSTDLTIKLANALIHSGKGKEANEIVERIRLGQNQSEGPLINLLAAEAAGAMQNYQQQLSSAQKASELGNKMDLPMITGRAWLLHGNALLNTGDAASAATSFGEAAKAYSQLSDQNGIAGSKIGAGDTLSAQNQLDTAKANYQEALGIYRQIANKQGAAQALFRLGMLSDKQGDADDAKAKYDEASQAFQLIHDKRSTARVLYTLGNLRSSQLDRAGARTTFEQALNLYQELNDQSGLAKTLNGLGDVLADQKDLDGAKKYYEQALSVSQGNLDQRNTARALTGIADISRDQNPTDAIAKYEEALKTLRSIDDKEYVGRTLYKYGTLLQKNNEIVKAKATFQEAVTFLTAAGDKSYLSRAQVSLGEISEKQKIQAINLLQAGFDLLNQKDYLGAQKKYEQALAVARESGDKANQVGALLNIGFLQSTQKDEISAEKSWQEAQQIAHEIGDKKQEAMAYWNLSVIAYNRRDLASAKNLYDQSAALFTAAGETPRPRAW